MEKISQQLEEETLLCFLEYVFSRVYGIILIWMVVLSILFWGIT